MVTTNRVHYYHADACAFGGYFDSPIEHTIAPQAPMSLSPSGGYGSARTENFRLEGLVSFKSASTQVSGRLSKKDDGGWVTLSSAVVEGLNVLDVLTADRLCAQISTHHPFGGNNPKVNFLGTSFENLRIAGHPVELTLDLDICDQGKPNAYPVPDIPCVSNQRFLDKVAEQYRQMCEAKNIPERVKDRAVPDWVRERYAWDNEKSGKNGGLLCSVVTRSSGKFPGRPFGNAIEVPGFGKVFLGELLVDCKSYQLTMVRLELGCPGVGQSSAATAKANGGTEPPS
jgi:hypothetical protein